MSNEGTHTMTKPMRHNELTKLLKVLEPGFGESSLGHHLSTVSNARKLFNPSVTSRLSNGKRNVNCLYEAQGH